MQRATLQGHIMQSATLHSQSICFRTAAKQEITVWPSTSQLCGTSLTGLPQVSYASIQPPPRSKPTRTEQPQTQTPHCHQGTPNGLLLRESPRVPVEAEDVFASGPALSNCRYLTDCTCERAIEDEVEECLLSPAPFTQAGQACSTGLHRSWQHRVCSTQPLSTAPQSNLLNTIAVSIGMRWSWSMRFNESCPSVYNFGE